MLSRSLTTKTGPHLNKKDGKGIAQKGERLIKEDKKWKNWDETEIFSLCKRREVSIVGSDLINKEAWNSGKLSGPVYGSKTVHWKDK